MAQKDTHRRKVIVAASLCKHRRNTPSKPLLRSMAQMNKSSRTAHLGNKGCGDRRVLLLDLRSALYGISASSGVALHFESASDLQRATNVCWSLFLLFVGGFSAPSLDRLWLRVVAASLCKHRRNTPSKPLLRSMAQMNKSSRITHLGKQGCGDRGS